MNDEAEPRTSTTLSSNLTPIKRWRRNIEQQRRKKICKAIYTQHEDRNIPINVISPWVHAQRGDPSIPSHTKGKTRYTPYVGKGKIFRPTSASWATVMTTKAKKGAPSKRTLGPSTTHPLPINDAELIIGSQLAVGNICFLERSTGDSPIFGGSLWPLPMRF